MGASPTRLLAVAFTFIAALTALAEAGTIRGSKHDLSVGGEGPVTAIAEQQVCIFCHVPHRPGAGERLFNRTAAPGPFTTYQSTTLSSPGAQPGGASTLCLSCHDGTIALGDLRSGSRTMANVTPGGQLPPGPTCLGTDLGDDHPLGIAIPAARTDLREPRAGEAVRLDGAGRLQCTSCHSPHDPEYPPFLVKADLDPTGTRGGQLCLTCHAPAGWPAGAHAQASGVQVPQEAGLRREGATVAQGSCLVCHRPHGAEEPERLGRGQAGDRCLTCHNGVPAPDLTAAAAAVSGHPLNGVRHDPAETLRGMPVSDRHAECPDCHDAHAACPGGAQAGPGAPGSLTGVAGVGAQYLGLPWSEPAIWQLKKVTAEYELCYKCHSGYSYGVAAPVSPSRRAADGVSAPSQPSPAVAFNPLNGGLHAVVGAHPRTGTGAPGAFRGQDRAGAAWGFDSILLCSDCHRPENGAAGPHGSNQPFILRAPWVHPAKDGTPTALPPTGAAGTSDHLCFKCHDPAAYLEGFGGSSGFRTSTGVPLHGTLQHRGACTNCHAGVPHGYKNRGLLVEATDPYPFNAGAKLRFPRDLAGQPLLAGSGNWQKTDCLSSCHTR